MLYEHLSFVVIVTTNSKRRREIGGRDGNLTNCVIVSSSDSRSLRATSVDVYWQTIIHIEHECDELPCVAGKYTNVLFKWRLSKVYLDEEFTVFYTKTNSNSICITASWIYDVPDAMWGRLVLEPNSSGDTIFTTIRFIQTLAIRCTEIHVLPGRRTIHKLAPDLIWHLPKVLHVANYALCRTWYWV